MAHFWPWKMEQRPLLPLSERIEVWYVSLILFGITREEKNLFATSATIVPKSHDFDVRNTLEKILANFDEVIPRLLPMSGCSAYQLPFPLLSERDFLLLSGLSNHWTMTDPDDAERLPDTFIRKPVTTPFTRHSFQLRLEMTRF